MDPALREHYLQMARDNPNMLCSDVPAEVLAETAYDDSDPSELLRAFLEVGFNWWLTEKHGGSIILPESMLRDALTVLWDRTCRLYNSHLLVQDDPD